MIITKERNIFKGYEGGEVVGGFDIATGHYIGKRGTAVKTAPKGFGKSAIENVRNNMEWGSSEYNVIHMLYEMVDHIGEHGYVQTSSMYERIVAVGLSTTWRDARDLSNADMKLNKKVIAFFKESEEGRASMHGYQKYLYLIECAQNGLKTEEEIRWYKELKSYLRRCPTVSISDKVIIKFIRLAVREHLDVLGYYNTCKDFVKYYSKSMNMYGNVDLERNFMLNYCTVESVYEIWENKNRDALLKWNDDSRLLYSNDIFTVVPLTSSEMFHKEATEQHNCVERIYMQKVVAHETHVVGIRAINDVDTPFITCEVSNRGEIIQYYRAWNTFPSSAEERLFREQYQNFLHESFNK